jgi:protein TorT
MKPVPSCATKAKKVYIVSSSSGGLPINIQQIILKAFVLLFLTTAFCFSRNAQARPNWFPYPVEIWNPPFDMNGRRSSFEYVPLLNVSADFNICVSFPHIKDTYWLAVDFGIAQEIKRFGSTMQLYQAGGYDNLGLQIKQIRQCVANGANGVIIGAISYDGLNNLVAELKEKNIPVIDVINGMSSNNIAAKSLVSFEEMGARAGEYLVGLQPEKSSEKKQIAWFPGPEGAGWVTAGNKGFLNAIAGSSLQVVATRYGDTGRAVQSALINEVLDTYAGQLDYIAGTGVTAEAAVRILKKRGLSKRIKILSCYLTPGVYRGILRGSTMASSTDSTVI